MKTVDRKIDDLIPAEYNPRQMTEKQTEDLRASLKRFGVVEPILINTHKDRKNIVIGGHQRLRVWKSLGNETIPCVEIKVARDRERELNVRLNQNTGKFDIEILKKEFDIQDLGDWGFGEDELSEIEEALAENDKKEEEEAPEIEFSEELMLRHNYIVLYFDNFLDWNVAMERFGLKKTKSCDPAEKCQKIGIGRVIDGAEALNIGEGKEE